MDYQTDCTTQFENRISNASTDIENEYCYNNPQLSFTSPVPNPNSSQFERISDEQKNFYSTFKERLESIYHILDQEIEPVFIRDLCGFKPRQIKLCNISSSLLNQRRQNKNSKH